MVRLEPELVRMTWEWYSVEMPVERFRDMALTQWFKKHYTMLPLSIIERGVTRWQLKSDAITHSHK